MRRVNAGVLAAFVWAVLLLLPALRTGYIGDDAYFSLLPGFLKYEHRTIPENIEQYTAGAVKVLGRFAPLNFVLIHGVFCTITNRLAYKLLLIVAVLVSLYLFYRFTSQVAGRGFAALTLISIIPLFEFRQNHDALFMYHMQMPVILMLTTGSLAFLFSYLESANNKSLVLSILLYVVSLFVYEITYLFFLLHASLIFWKVRGFRQRVKLASLYVAPVFLCGLIMLILKHSAASQANPYAPHWDTALYFRALTSQIFAALPLSYFLQDPARIFPSISRMFEGKFAMCALIFLIGFAAALLAIREFKKEPSAPLHRLAILGVLLWILPAVLIALSPQYQKILKPGVAHLPVYVEYYGVGLLLACGLCIVTRSISNERSAPVALSLVIASISAITYAANATVATSFNAWLYPRENHEIALHAGFLKDIPDGSRLDLTNSWPWEDKYFVYLHSGKRLLMAPQLFETISNQSWAQGLQPDPKSAPHSYEMRDYMGAPNPESAIIILTRIDDRNDQKKGTKQAEIFVRVPQAQDLVLQAILFEDPTKLLTATASDLQTLATGTDWKILRLETKDELEVNSIQVRLLRKSSAATRSSLLIK